MNESIPVEPDIALRGKRGDEILDQILLAPHLRACSDGALNVVLDFNLSVGRMGVMVLAYQVQNVVNVHLYVRDEFHLELDIIVYIFLFMLF